MSRLGTIKTGTFCMGQNSNRSDWINLNHFLIHNLLHFQYTTIVSDLIMKTRLTIQEVLLIIMKLCSDPFDHFLSSEPFNLSLQPLRN